jgi:hypothetical protein
MVDFALTYEGPPIDDVEILDRVPSALAGVLQQVNGFIQFGGGLHVRGACRQPTWHSLREAWLGDKAFHCLYPAVVRSDDVPFAEDCMGDQFLLRGEIVWRLSAETGDAAPLNMSLGEFLQEAQVNPVEFLSLNPLVQFQNEGGHIEPGQLLNAYPPFCFAESGAGVSLKAVPAGEQRRYLSDLAKQIREVPDGGQVKIRTVK